MIVSRRSAALRHRRVAFLYRLRSEPRDNCSTQASRNALISVRYRHAAAGTLTSSLAAIRVAKAR